MFNVKRGPCDFPYLVGVGGGWGQGGDSHAEEGVKDVLDSGVG